MGHHQKPGERHETDPPSEPPKRPSFVRTLDVEFLASRIRKELMYAGLNCQVYDNLLQQPKETTTVPNNSRTLRLPIEITSIFIWL